MPLPGRVIFTTSFIALSARSEELRAKLVEFDNEIVRPAEPLYRSQREESGDPHFPPPVMEELKLAEVEHLPKNNRMRAL